MIFEKFKSSLPVNSSLRAGIAELNDFFIQNKGTSIIPLILPSEKAVYVEEKCLALFKEHKDELHSLPVGELKDLLSNLSLNFNGKIFHIIDCFKNSQIKELFNTPQNKPDPSGFYGIGMSNPYAFTGFISERLSGGWGDYAQLYEGYGLLRKNHPNSISLVVSASVFIYGLERGLFSLSLLSTNSFKDDVDVAWHKIVDCFETNKEQIHKAYGGGVDTPLAWMNAFLKNCYPTNPENLAFRDGIRNYAEKLMLDASIPASNGKRSVMKV